MKFEDFFSVPDKLFSLNGYTIKPLYKNFNLWLSTFVIILAPISGYIYIYQHIDDLNAMGSLVTNEIILTQALMMGISIFYFRKRLQGIKYRLKIYYENQKSFFNYTKNLNFFWYCAIGLTMGVASAEVSCFLAPIINGVINILKGNPYPKVLHHITYMPFDYDSSWFLYILAEIFLKLAGFYFNNLVCACECYMECLIYLLSMELHILGDQFEQFDFSSNDVEKLKVLIKKHENLLKIRDELEEIFSYTILGVFLCNTYLTCFSLLQLFITSDIGDILKFCVYFIAVLIKVFLICFFCQFLKSSNERIFHQLMKSNWRLSNEAMRKNVNLIALRALDSIELSAGGFVKIDMKSFTQVSENLSNI